MSRDTIVDITRYTRKGVQNKQVECEGKIYALLQVLGSEHELYTQSNELDTKAAGYAEC